MFNHSLLTRILGLSLCVSIIISATAYGQKPEPKAYPEGPDYVNRKDLPNIYRPTHITKKPGHYTITDWDEAIDETWGWGSSRSYKLWQFDTFWNIIDEEFACFVDHPDYYPGLWDDLRDLYRTEIDEGDPTYGVSRGRFAAIMNYLSMALKESHTRARDSLVNIQTVLEPGVPLLVVGAFGDNGHFGAALTPLPDSSLLVYKTVQDHPLGLEPGDIVLGYDGIPWKELYPVLIEAQLPMYLYWPGFYWGSSASSYTHSWLKAAGMNWHLFDTIDIVKYSTEDTLHLSVEPLIGQNMQLLCTEQMDIPGVPMPDIDAGFRSSYGIIEGTSIGYIYVWSWADNIEQEFYSAVNSLMNDYETTGLIIDFRLDYWGYMHLSNKGFGLLFNAKEPLVGWAQGSSPDDHLSFTPMDYTYFDHLYGSPLNYYDKPIAVLTGSGSFSVGDFIVYAIKCHPMTRFFGKPVMGAMNYFISFSSGYYYWSYSRVNTFPLDDPGNYLTRWELEVDDDVWLTPDDVAQGYDTVVEAASDWINGLQGTQPNVEYDPVSFEVSVEYGQETAQDLTITNNATRHLFYSLTPQVGGRLDLHNEANIQDAQFISPSNPVNGIPKNGSEKATADYTRPEPIVLGHGGFDSFGHVWIDSDQPHGPSFDWVDISGTGTPVSLSNNSFAGPIDIGFEFPFYENTYSELYISSNGLITFEDGTTDYSNDNIPDINLPNNFIAPWWDDLNPSYGGAIYYYHDIIDDCFIVSYVFVPRYFQGQRIARATCEVILFPDGSIRFNHLSMDMEMETIFDVYSATVGIENSDGSDGLEIFFDAPYTIDNYSILITTDWLAVSPYSSYIAPGENEVSTVTFNAKHVLPGNYTGNIHLESNDPDEPSVVIPVSLEVTGCAYTPGDCNHNGTALELADVMAMIGLYRGSVDPYYTCDCPPHGSEFAPEADPNGNCVPLELADVVTEIAAYRGSTEASGCEDCPGSPRLRASGEDHPSVTPSLKTKAKKTAPASQ